MVDSWQLTVREILTCDCRLSLSIATEIIMLDFITWTADPAIFTIGSREIRWYGLAFAIGFAIGYMIVERMWKKEGLPPAWIDSLLIYTMLGTVIGARLGHCLFYAPEYYLANPIEIFQDLGGRIG